MVILLHRINDSLAGSEIDSAHSCDGIGRGATLSGMLPFTFNGDFLIAKDVELALGKRLLINLTAFGRGSNRVKNTTFSDTGLDVLSYQLVAVTGNANPRIFGCPAGGGGLLALR